MYISQDVKDKIRAIPILRLAEDIGISVRRKAALCFMHDDRHPSLAFNTSKNTWKCYVCDKGGDQVTLVMEKLGLTYIDACKWIADKYGITIPDDDGYRRRIVIKKTAQKKQTPVTESKPVDTEMMTWIVNHAGLSDFARKFLFETRKYKPEVVEQLHIGSISDADRLVRALISVFGIERSLASGIVRKNSRGLYLFYYTPCLIFPYTDIDGNVVNIQTRYLGSTHGIPRFQFLPSTEIRMFNMSILKELKLNEKLFISEGITDCIALLSSGRKAVAIPSATLLNKNDIRYLVSKNLFMYPDRDDAGNRLYDNLCDILKEYGTMIVKCKLPDNCKDFSDYFMTQSN